MPSHASRDRADLETAIGSGTTTDIELSVSEWAVVGQMIEQTRSGTRMWKPAEIYVVVRAYTRAQKNPAAVVSVLDKKGVFEKDAARAHGGKRIVRMLNVRYLVDSVEVFPGVEPVQASVEAQVEMGSASVRVVRTFPQAVFGQSESYPLPLASFTAYQVICKQAAATNERFFARDVKDALRERELHGSTSGIIWELEQRGLVKKVHGTPRSRSTPLAYEVVRVRCHHPHTGATFDPTSNVPASVRIPEPSLRMASLEELEVDRAEVERQIREAERPHAEWSREDSELSAIVEQHREALSRAEQLREAHKAAEPVLPDTVALIEQQTLLDQVISNYLSFRSVLAR